MNKFLYLSYALVVIWTANTLLGIRINASRWAITLGFINVIVWTGAAIAWKKYEN